MAGLVNKKQTCPRVPILYPDVPKMGPNLFQSTEYYALGLKDERRIDNCLNH